MWWMGMDMDRVDVATADVTTEERMKKRSYRVLMIAPTSFFADYGCHVRILEEARILQSLGHSITIATYQNGKDVAGIDIRRSLPIPWRRDYEVGSSRHKIAFDLLLGLKTLQLLVRHHYDVIHAHLHEGALMGLVLGRLFNLPTVFDFQGSLTEEMIDHRFLRRDSSLYSAMRRLEEWIDHRSSVVLTSSRNAERILIEEFTCDPARIQTVPDCVSTEVFKPADAYSPALLADKRQTLGIPLDAKVIVYLGLLAEYQGTSLLLEATSRIVAEHPNVYLLLMGFPGVDVYQHEATLLGIAGHVRFTGRVPYEDAPIHLALGDAAVAPKLSLTEGSGKLLNYMAVALPTVAFDTPVAHEYLGSNGFFAERGSVVSLTEQLKAALALDSQADGGRAMETGTNLRRRAIERYDWRGAAKLIEAAYAAASGHEVVELPSEIDRL
jgi:glycosyltransferase involved in cell wall biosynthesis